MVDWTPRLLVCDDEDVQRNILNEILTSAGFSAVTAGSVEEGVAAFQKAMADGQPIDLVLTDLKMPGDTEGLDLLQQVKDIDPRVEVILMTAYSTVRSAVQAMKLGAFEYLPKPFDKERLLQVVNQVIDKLRLVHENRRLRELVGGEDRHRMIGSGAQMQELFRIIDRVGQTDTTCLIRGESGTGKELVARAIHRGGARATKPFIAINCAAIPESLIESELFGHEKGVFTGATTTKMGRFEEVGEGTLFLDEIGSMKYDLQAKLLRVIQEREFSRVGSAQLVPFNGRIVAATAQDLEELIAENQFREDLFFRLNVVPLEIPALRERKEDIPTLVELFIRKGQERLGTTVQGVRPEVLEAFENYEWPGNVRELENVVERLLVLGDSEYLDATLLPPQIRDGEPRRSVAGQAVREPVNAAPEGSNGQQGGSGLDGSGDNGFDSMDSEFALPASGVVLEDLEAGLIRQALERTGGRIEPAAQLLGITYKTLQYRIKKYDLKTIQGDARRRS
ncbi:MAG: sigma-54 dependent transcriptional regulator [Planctomycetota bacterium]